MLTESPTLHDAHNSPGPSHSPRQNGSPAQWKGKAPMYPRKSWDRTGDPRVTNDPPDPGLPSLLARIQSPTRNHSGGEDRFADNSSLASRIAPPAREDGEIEPEGEGEDSFATSEKLQDAPKALSVPTGNGVRIKTEETVPVISNPSPTRERPVGRQRGSRSTIDVVRILHRV